MVRVGSKHGIVVLESEQIDFKITPDREVWVRHGKPIVAKNGEVRYEKPQNFRTMGRKIEKGLSTEEKQIFLVKLRNRILLNSDQTAKSEQSQDSEHEDDDEQHEQEDDVDGKE